MSLRIRENVSLAERTTLGVGGVARYFTEVATLDELMAAVRFAKQNELPLFILGGGSNVLVSDAGYAGLVISVAIKGIKYKDIGSVVQATVGAGEVLDSFIADTVARGYWGLENLSHIPGTVGATPVQNVGAYGVEVSDVIVSVVVFHIPTESLRTFTNVECTFGYRDSFFKTSLGKEYVIVTVSFRLSVTPRPQLAYTDLRSCFPGGVATLADIRTAVIAIRAKKFPDWHTVGTAGSFFKNPIIPHMQVEELRKQYPELPLYPADEECVKVSLGYILDKVCGLRGYREGKIRLYEHQALVLVVDDGATATDVCEFAKRVVNRVREATGITIAWEVNILA